MAKRFHPLKEFGRTTKKPKLDVSVSKGRPLGPTQSWPLMGRTSLAGVPNDIGSNLPGTSPGRKPLNHNLWDDDDDDVILLATQVAESQVAFKTAPTSMVTEITDSEITFSEFAPQVHATTSTQRNIAVSVPVPDKKQLSEMFDDDDEFVELVNSVGKKPTKECTQAKADEQYDVFKVPTLPMNKNKILSSSEGEGIDGQTAAARHQVASERQIKLLTERLDALKAENAKLLKDLSESKAKIESKDGESSLLRDELRHMKQQLQTLKMEKIFNAEAAKTENKTKIAELTKRVEAKETELKLRNVEYSVLKLRHADETQRLEMSIRNATVLGDVTMEDNQENRRSTSKQRTLHRLRGLTLRKSRSSMEGTRDRLTELNAQVYEQTHERGTTKRQHTPFQLELNCIQTLLAQLQMQEQKRTWTTDEMKDFGARAIASVCKVFAEFWTYVHSLEFLKNCNVLPYHEYDICLDKPHTFRNLHQPAELYDNESAPSLRRYVAALSVMCEQSQQFACQLLKAQHGEFALLQVAIDAIAKMGYSREICAHFGVLEAFAALLHVLLLRTEPNTEQLQLLINLLKQLVFVRPSAWIFRAVSSCLLLVMRIPEAMGLLCVNSDESTFYSDRMRSIYRFSNDSCLLQVYAGLLEITFPLNSTLHLRHFQLLIVICENHVRFVQQCFMNPPDFVHKLLPSYDDDDDMDEDANHIKCNVEALSINSNSSTSTCTTNSNVSANFTKASAVPVATDKVNTITRCECYTKLCLSVLTLLFQLLRQWMRSGRQTETARVAEVSQVAVQLLHIIFCDNYTTRLFRYSEETTKHYLWLICEWWTESGDLLQFNNVHNNFLRKLRNFHIMPKLLREEGSTGNVEADLREWYVLTNDKKDDRTHNIGEKKLKLMEHATDLTTFFEGLQGYAFNFE